VKNKETYRRITLREYIRILDEEEGLKETYYKTLKRKLKQHLKLKTYNINKTFEFCLASDFKIR